MIRKILGWPPTVILSALLFIILILAVFVGSIGSTLGDFSFVKQELKDVEAYSLAKQWLDDNIDDYVPGIQDSELYQVFKDSLSETWMAGQVDGVLDITSDYLDGKRDDITATISLAGFKENMKVVLRNTVQNSPPEGVQGLKPAEVEEYLQRANTAIDELPASITVNVAGVSALEPVRDIPGAVDSVSTILLMTIALLAILVVLLHWLVLQTKLKTAGIYLGSFLLSVGAVCLIIKAVIISVSSGIVEDEVNNGDIPSPLNAEVVNRVISDSLSPASIWAIAFIVLGIGIIVASIFLIKGKPEKKAKTEKPATQAE